MVFDIEENNPRETGQYRTSEDGAVNSYTKVKEFTYPLLRINLGEDTSMYKLKLLKAMIEKRTLEDEDFLNVYILLQGKNIGIGKLSRKMLRPILQSDIFSGYAFEIEQKQGGKKITGEYLLALCCSF